VVKGEAWRATRPMSPLGSFTVDQLAAKVRGLLDGSV